jgi:MFS family permease
LAILLTGLAWSSWWYFRGRLFLKRGISTQVPELTTVALETRMGEWPERGLIRAAARVLRRRYPVGSPELDINPTIEQTIRNNGEFTPVLSTSWLSPEYLVLIDRRSFRDHSACYVDEIVNQFQSDQVHIRRYYFDQDPRVLVSFRKQEPPVFLEALMAGYSDFRVLIFSDGAGFFNPISGELESWTEPLWQRPQLVLLTPKPREAWGYEENILASRTLLLPATSRSFEIFARSANGLPFHSRPVDTEARPFPAMLSERPTRWLDRDSPPPEVVDDVLKSVYRYLDEDGYLWFSACAVYPEIHFNLTIYLGTNLKSALDLPFFSSERVNALFRLPWLRYGYMPDWLRLRLVRDLSRKNLAKIQEVLNRLWLSVSVGNKTAIDLEIARKHPHAMVRLGRNVFQRLRRKFPDAAPLQDYVFVSVMLGRSLDPLAVRIPAAWRKFLAGRKEQTIALRPGTWKAVFAIWCGQLLHWCDFLVFGTLAPVLASKFYPPGNTTFALAAYVLTLLVGFVVRPVGALIFGSVGDRLGRRPALLRTISIAGGSTFLMGVLPSYETAGWFSPLALLVLRVLQGLAMGGELGGAAVYTFEHAPYTRRGLYTSIIQMTPTLGFILVMIITLTLSPLLPNNFWRPLFLLSIFPAGVCFYLRLKMPESPFFVQNGPRRSISPVKYAFTEWFKHPRAAFSLFALASAQGAVWYTGQYYSLYFLQAILRVSPAEANRIMLTALLIGSPFFIAFGRLADRIGYKKLIMAGCLLALLAYYPIYGGMRWASGSSVDTIASKSSSIGTPVLTPQANSNPVPVMPVKHLPVLLLLISIQVIFAAMVYAPFAAYMASAADPLARYTGASFPYQIGSGAVATLVPITGLYACAMTGNVYAGLWFPMSVIVITFLLAPWMKQTENRPGPAASTGGRRHWFSRRKTVHAVEMPTAIFLLIQLVAAMILAFSDNSSLLPFSVSLAGLGVLLLVIRNIQRDLQQSKRSKFKD